VPIVIDVSKGGVWRHKLTEECLKANAHENRGYSAACTAWYFVHKQQVGFYKTGRDNRGRLQFLGGNWGVRATSCRMNQAVAAILFCSGVGLVALSASTCA
jgi:hypothetical protein